MSPGEEEFEHPATSPVVRPPDLDREGRRRLRQEYGIEFPGTLGTGDFFVVSTVWTSTDGDGREPVVNYFINANP